MKTKIINEYITMNEGNSNGVGELHVEGDISSTKWWDEDVTPKDIATALNELGDVKNLDVYINSFGGSCPAGNSIVNIIDTYRAKHGCYVTSYIRGIAASMGSGIAMVGDKIVMADNALFMIHKPLITAYGNADELQKNIDILNKTEDCLVKNYMRKFNGTEEELRELMAQETWMTADEALEYGFVDEIDGGIEMVASAKGLEVGNQMFNNKIAELINKKCPKAQIKKKEEKILNYDEALKDYGIDEETFKAFNLESEVILNVAKAVKVEKEEPAPVEQFVDKATVCEALDCEDITADEIINLAKAGKNPPKMDEASKEKADAYDRILKNARDTALKNAVRAQGDLYNEERTKKMLNALDYEDVIEQDKAWGKEAEMKLHAGERVSFEDTAYSRNVDSKNINPRDFISD